MSTNALFQAPAPGPASPAPTHDEGEPLLRVHDLSKYFPLGGLFSKKVVHALEGVSFSITRGQVVALVGESGSGKSTTARLIARLMAPTRGEIIFKGQDVLKTERGGASPQYRGAVQMIFQDPFGSLNPAHSVAHHLARPLRVRRMVAGRRELSERIGALLATVGLTPVEEFAAKYPHQLSGGQRQRVAIARALAVEPEVILADEPISMLDMSIRMGVLNLMERLKEERGIGYLYITHDIASARYIGDRTMVLYAGYMVEGAPGEELMRNPAHPYTRLLLSAVPDPRAGRGRRQIAARGEVPSLVDRPAGCPFAPRCAHAMKICSERMPDAELVGADHWVRCHLYGPGQQVAGASEQSANNGLRGGSPSQ